MSHTSPPTGPAGDPQLAASWSGWIGDHTTALIGIPLRIALIVVVLLVVRVVAKRAITRVVQRVLEPSAGEAERGRPRRSGRGAAVLHRDRSGRGSVANSGPARSARCSAVP
ncbi:hypothetical protein ACWGIV_37510 [Streptomyces sp. NPDC054844]